MFLNKKISFVFTLIFSIYSNTTNADTIHPNGCGSGWNTNLVPDYVPLLKCELQASCNNHDQCYGACDGESPILGIEVCKYRDCQPNGRLFGSPTCKTLEYKRSLNAATSRKAQCDNKFYNDILISNKNRSACKVFAKVYQVGVVAWGKSAFAGAVTISSMTDSEKHDSEIALKEYLLNSTEEELQKFYLAMESKDPPIDLKRPLKYNATTKRLMNSR